RAMAPLVPRSRLPPLGVRLARALCTLSRSDPIDLVRGRRYQHEAGNRLSALVVSERDSPPCASARGGTAAHWALRLLQRALPRPAVDGGASMAAPRSRARAAGQRADVWSRGLTGGPAA